SDYFSDPFLCALTRRVRSGRLVRLAFGFAGGSLALRLSSITYFPYFSVLYFSFAFSFAFLPLLFF
ncbi:hypothetical protein, partial [Herbaspirillum seropedicae]|uniref:hypothetical protein n=1 Tax=Herbaspirillum seropedicae TaxID=964 RepID=UPI003392E3EE